VKIGDPDGRRRKPVARTIASVACNRYLFDTSGTVRRSPAPGPFSGDFSEGETHVPIPNTIVKPLGPMIVLKGAKVGHRRDHLQAARSRKTVSRLSFEPLLA
jgi:hypothetical protein